MKITSSRGFTLIELVVVIVILGILAATAAPKFMSLQSDARAASLKGVEAALKSADKVFYAKAVMQGADKTCDFDHKVKIDENWVYVCYGHVLPLSNTPGNFELDKVADIDIENDYSYVPDDGDDYLYGYYFFKNQEFEKITNTGERYSKYLELKDKCSVMYRLNQESGRPDHKILHLRLLTQSPSRLVFTMSLFLPLFQTPEFQPIKPKAQK